MYIIINNHYGTSQKIMMIHLKILFNLLCLMRSIVNIIIHYNLIFRPVIDKLLIIILVGN